MDCACGVLPHHAAKTGVEMLDGGYFKRKLAGKIGGIVLETRVPEGDDTGVIQRGERAQRTAAARTPGEGFFGEADGGGGGVERGETEMDGTVGGRGGDHCEGEWGGLPAGRG